MSDINVMLADIERETELTRTYIGKNRLDKRVLTAMKRVARDQFVPDDVRPWSFANRPLSIGHGQTISQPFIVALMTDLINPQASHKVLEIGTGSGYQAAILATLVKAVYSIEIIADLATQAEERLTRMGYRNVRVRAGDGYQGWPEEAPFDGILVTAAAPHVPPALVAQLRPGGRMVIPVGPPFGPQDLRLVVKDESGDINEHFVLPVAFVPLTGNHGMALDEPTRC